MYGFMSLRATTIWSHGVKYIASEGHQKPDVADSVNLNHIESYLLRETPIIISNTMSEHD